MFSLGALVQENLTRVKFAANCFRCFTLKLNFFFVSFFPPSLNHSPTLSLSHSLTLSLSLSVCLPPPPPPPPPLSLSLVLNKCKTVYWTLNAEHSKQMRKYSWARLHNTQWTHGAMITSSLCQNDIADLFWCNDTVLIMSHVRWVIYGYWLSCIYPESTTPRPGRFIQTTKKLKTCFLILSTDTSRIQ